MKYKRAYKIEVRFQALTYKLPFRQTCRLAYNTLNNLNQAIYINIKNIYLWLANFEKPIFLLSQIIPELMQY